MRSNTYILRLTLLFVLSLVMYSCTKEPVNGNEGELVGYTKVNLSVNLTAECSTKAEDAQAKDNQGNTIKDITVWAYAISAVNGSAVNPDEQPVAYAFFSSASGSLDLSNLSMELPVYTEVKYYRFFAVANKSLLGVVYKPRELGQTQEQLNLDGSLTYYNLSTSIFDSRGAGGIMWQLTNAAAMPFSHWTDMYVPAAVKSEEGTSSSLSATLNLYRTVAKTEFNAQLSSTSASGATLTIKNLFLHSSSDMAIAVQGALFSDIIDVNESNVPGMFGYFSHFKVGYLTGKYLYNTTNNYGDNSFNDVVLNERKTGNTDCYKPVGSIYLYENHLGQEYKSGKTSTVSPADYKPGAYYIEVQYNYYVPKTAPQSEDKTGKGVCYLPLPVVVRNHKYTINATFDVTNDGHVVLANYSVLPWDVSEGNNETIEFSYPTITVWSTKTDSNGFVYEKPVMSYKGINGGATEDGAFAFYFKMEKGNNAKDWSLQFTEYTVNNEGVFVADDNQKDDFAVSVYKCGENSSEEKLSNFSSVSEHGVQYKIKIYPKNTYESTQVKVADVYITYIADWLGGKSDRLLINATSGGTLWPESGGEKYKIRVTQIEDLSNGQ